MTNIDSHGNIEKAFNAECMCGHRRAFHFANAGTCQGCARDDRQGSGGKVFCERFAFKAA